MLMMVGKLGEELPLVTTMLGLAGQQGEQFWGQWASQLAGQQRGQFWGQWASQLAGREVS